MIKNIKEIGLNILEKEFLNLNFNDENYLFSYILIFENLSEKEKKSFYKNFKKSIIFFFKNFDENYLLFKKQNEINYAINFLFLFLYHDLIEILEEKNEENLIEKIIDIKLKMELGVKRYLQFNENILIYSFNLENKEFIKIDKKNIKLEIDNKKYLTYLLFLKNLEKKFEIKKEIQKYFYEFIYTKKNLKELKIKKSLYLENNLDLLELKNNLVLENINSPIIVILTLILLKNEKK